MSNLDNQPGRDPAGVNTRTTNARTPDDRIVVNNRNSGIGAGTITAIIAAVVIAGALMLFGPWGNNNRTAVSNSTPATTSSTNGATTGQTSTAPRVITPPASTTTTPAPNTTR